MMVYDEAIREMAIAACATAAGEFIPVNPVGREADGWNPQTNEEK
jgi:hypothetical protein